MTREQFIAVCKAVEAKGIHRLYSIELGFCNITDENMNRDSILETMAFSDALFILNRYKIQLHGKKDNDQGSKT